MPRPKKDGTAASAAHRRNLTELLVRRLRPELTAFNVWDIKERGLVLRVQPSGHRAFKFVYSHRSSARWYHIGAIHLADARRIAAKLRLAVAEGKDPLAERKAQRASGTFKELADLYLEQHAKKKNKSWPQARALVERHLLPKWGRLDAKAIGRADVRHLIGSIAAPVLANQVLASASAIFTWAVKQEIVAANPCRGIERNDDPQPRAVLSESELPRFWRRSTTPGWSSARP